jgi:hypothetical protein
MDRAILERAVKALAALNMGSGIETRAAPAQVSAPVTQAEESNDEEIAAYRLSSCAGCYEVEPGVRIHPPKCGEGYRTWLERWEANGRLQ